MTFLTESWGPRPSLDSEKEMNSSLCLPPPNNVTNFEVVQVEKGKARCTCKNLLFTYYIGSSRLTFSSVAVMITFVVARNPNTFLIKTPATFFYRYMSFKIQSTKRITSFLWKPTFEWKGKNRPCILKKQPELNE